MILYAVVNTEEVKEEFVDQIIDSIHETPQAAWEARFFLRKCTPEFIEQKKRDGWRVITLTVSG